MRSSAVGRYDAKYQLDVCGLWVEEAGGRRQGGFGGAHNFGVAQSRKTAKTAQILTGFAV